jgi:hypothetical protein
MNYIINRHLSLNEHELNNLKHKITNKNIKKIVNVYQHKYENTVSNGFGDYLRGCISLSLLCYFLNLEFGMNIKNHPIHNFIIIDKHIDDNISYGKIKGISIVDKPSDINAIQEIIKEINSNEMEICYLYTTLYFEEEFLRKYYNKLYTMNVIKYLIPNDEILNPINKTRSIFKLNKNNYDIIHIRGGDNLLINNYASKEYINAFISFIIKKLRYHINNSKFHIIIGDNKICKLAIKNATPNSIMFDIDPIHLGMNNLNNSNVKGTMFDFFLLANATNVISFSRYMHGSGFSKWGSFLFNRPHIQYSFTDINSKFSNLIN